MNFTFPTIVCVHAPWAAQPGDRSDWMAFELAYVRQSSPNQIETFDLDSSVRWHAVLFGGVA